MDTEAGTAVMVTAMAAVLASTTQEWESMAAALSVTAQAFSVMLSTSDTWLLDSVTPGTAVTAADTGMGTSGTLLAQFMVIRAGLSAT
jgi:hypothetical protein